MRKNNKEDARFLWPKASLQNSSTLSDKKQTPERSARGFTLPSVTEPARRFGLGSPPGATPTKLCHHTMGSETRSPKPELSTLVGLGTFYFGPTGVWLPIVAPK